MSNQEHHGRIAAIANAVAYDQFESADYIDGAPHIKHGGLRRLYAEQLHSVFKKASLHAPHPRVLDLGAGEGSVTFPMLELGCSVVAVDISCGQLKRLEIRCAAHSSRLETRCQDLSESIADPTASYDVIVANSLLHHIPDYIALLRAAFRRLAPRGVFFSFQDPMRYSTMPWVSRKFGAASYLVWRLGKKDVIGGLKRRFRRGRGVFLANSEHDNIEYHVVRDGVDQDAIRALCEVEGFDCEVTRYFSTQSRLMQPVGSALRFFNTFSIIATRAAPDAHPHREFPGA